MDIRITDTQLAKLIKDAEKKDRLTKEEAETISCALEDLRLQKQSIEGLSNGQFYRWLEQQ